MTSIAVALIVAALQPGSASAAVQATQEKVRTSLNTWIKSEGAARTKAKEQARKAVAELIDFDALVRNGTISAPDVNLVYRTDSVDEAFAWITGRLGEFALDRPGAML